LYQNILKWVSFFESGFATRIGFGMNFALETIRSPRLILEVTIPKKPVTVLLQSEESTRWIPIGESRRSGLCFHREIKISPI